MITFFIVAAVAVAAAIGVIAARNAVHSVLWLVVHLCSLAVLYMTLHAEFLGLVQILIYAGAVMILFLFVLSLLSARSAPNAAAWEQPRGQTGLAIAAAAVVAALVLVGAAVGNIAAPTQGAAGGAAAFGTVQTFGQALFGPYLLPFEGTALALLTAIVGAVALSAGHDDAAGRGLPATVAAEPADGAPIDVSHAAPAEPVATGGDR